MRRGAHLLAPVAGMRVAALGRSSGLARWNWGLLTTDRHGQASLTLALIRNGASVSAARLFRSVVLAQR